MSPDSKLWVSWSRDGSSIITSTRNNQVISRIQDKIYPELWKSDGSQLVHQTIDGVGFYSLKEKKNIKTIKNCNFLRFKSRNSNTI